MAKVAGAVVIFILLAGILAGSQAEVDAPARFGDFAAYWVAGNALLAGEDPFDPAVVERIEQRYGLSQAYVVWNPPWFFAVIAPFAALPLDLAAVLWCGMNVGLVLAVGVTIGRRIGFSEFWAVVLSMTFVPVAVCLGFSQWSILVLAGVVGFDECQRRGNFLLAGLCLSLATLKPHLVMLVWLIPVFVGDFRSRVRMIAGGTLGVASMTTICLAIEPGVLHHYWDALTHPAPSAPTNYFSATMAEWLAWSVRETFPQTKVYGLRFLPLVVGLFAWAWILVQGWPRHRRIEWAILGSMLVLPYGWHYDQSLLLPVYLVSCGMFLKMKGLGAKTVGMMLLLAWELGYAGMLAAGGLECRYAVWPAALSLAWVPALGGSGIIARTGASCHHPQRKTVPLAPPALQNLESIQT